MPRSELKPNVKKPLRRLRLRRTGLGATGRRLPLTCLRPRKRFVLRDLQPRPSHLKGVCRPAMAVRGLPDRQASLP